MLCQLNFLGFNMDEMVYDGGRLPGEQPDYRLLCRLLIGALGHEFNNTLTALLGEAQLMQYESQLMQHGSVGKNSDALARVVNAAHEMRAKVAAFQEYLKDVGEHGVQPKTRGYNGLTDIADITPYLNRELF